MATRATPEQKEWLEALGIIATPKYESNRSLIDFLAEGNMTGGKTVEERIEQLRRLQRDWIGSRVRRIDRNVEGTALYLFAHTRHSMWTLEHSARPDAKLEWGFSAVIRWDRPGNPATLRLTRLELLPPPAAS